MSRSRLRRKVSDDADFSDISQNSPKMSKKSHSQVRVLSDKNKVLETQSETQKETISRLEKELHSLKRDKTATIESMETKLELANKRWNFFLIFYCC